MTIFGVDENPSDLRFGDSLSTGVVVLHCITQLRIHFLKFKEPRAFKRPKFLVSCSMSLQQMCQFRFDFHRGQMEELPARRTTNGIVRWEIGTAPYRLHNHIRVDQFKTSKAPSQSGASADVRRCFVFRACTVRYLVGWAFLLSPLYHLHTFH